MELTYEQQSEIKESYFNILSIFLEQNEIKSEYLKSLLKWGFQLKLTPHDLKKFGQDLKDTSFVMPQTKMEKFEAIYHLVYLIQLDQIIEDVELEIAAIFANKLGFSRELVAETLKAIATEPDDNFKVKDMRKDVLDFLHLNADLFNQED